MRPRGTLGPVALALRHAAQHAGPGTVEALAARAGVGYAVARYTASRMVDRGELVVLYEGRPAVLDVPAPAVEPAADDLVVDAYQLLTVDLWQPGVTV